MAMENKFSAGLQVAIRYVTEKDKWRMCIEATNIHELPWTTTI